MVRKKQLAPQTAVVIDSPPERSRILGGGELSSESVAADKMRFLSRKENG
jgi:hypothetical protein